MITSLLNNADRTFAIRSATDDHVPMGNGLGAAAIVDDAIARTGIDDVGDEWFLGPLGRWADDLRHDNLTDGGRAFMRRLAVSDVARRLEVDETIRQHPEILDVELPPIVYITGLERSGTTLLHNLLALHRSLRPLLRWELMRPVPPPAAATHADDPRIAEVQAAIEPLRGGLLERMHWVNADEPEECAWGFIDAVGMLGQAAGLCMTGWADFLRTEDMTPAFEHYRQVVQLLTWQHPVAPGGRLVLKCPQISWDLAEFAAVFPEAHFVVTHRDPYRALVSVMVMGESLMEPFCVANPVRGSLSGPDGFVERTGRRLAGIERFDDDHPGRTTHVAYPAVADDPAATVAWLVDRLGLPDDPDHAGRVAAFLDAQRRGARADPPARLDDMGLQRETLASQPGVASYCARYGVEPELERLTGAPPQPST
jgi:hypothetical protein